jgi:4-amino-4-deoxy-L-arabinose transferase-like glycosyltransferase
LNSIYLSALGIPGISIESIYLNRYFTVIMGTLASPFVVYLGYRLGGLSGGLLSGLIYSMEPFIIRFGRIGIIETTTLFFILIVLTFLVNFRNTRNYIFFLGIILGLSFITNDLALLLIPTLIITYFWLRGKWFFDLGNRSFLYSSIIGLSIYGAYQIWGILSDSTNYFPRKTDVLLRTLGFSQTNGYGITGNSSFVSNITSILIDYSATWIILALSIIIFAKRRKNVNRTEIMIMSYYIGSLVFFLGFVRTFNVQYSVYILLPAIILVGGILPSFMKKKRNYVILISFIILLLSSYGYTRLYLVEDDKAYNDSLKYITENIPAESVIAAHWSFQHFLDDFGYSNVQALPNMDFRDLIEKSIEYVVVIKQYSSSYDQEILDYISQEGTIIASFQGRSLEQVDIIRLIN